MSFNIHIELAAKKGPEENGYIQAFENFAKNRAAKFIFPNSGLHTKDLNSALGIARSTNTRRGHIVLF